MARRLLAAKVVGGCDRERDELSHRDRHVIKQQEADDQLSKVQRERYWMKLRKKRHLDWGVCHGKSRLSKG
ncbi:hypothetical protein LBSG162_24690 [Lentilactobacillus buchneri subsp. silagei]|uniref:Uncharacterized protein n=1 Tax=Lentilactobacillus kefiri TaxID=33962 RepID=A0A511DWZ6_LENKE|nr:hypothetical protein LBSG162_24690 [Lentilactobacillus buchneri subsp. silagei]GEL29362.1 hypothetical protein LKE01_21820 [Lentilactobacillus kefiri]